MWEAFVKQRTRLFIIAPKFLIKIYCDIKRCDLHNINYTVQGVVTIITGFVNTVVKQNIFIA